MESCQPDVLNITSNVTANLISSAAMGDPVAFGAVFSAIGTTFKLAEFVLALKEVDEENKVFIVLINRVRTDLDEAFRLRRNPVIQNHLLSNLEKESWIDGTILDTQKALNDIGVFVENARIDEAKGRSVTLAHRFMWVLSHHKSIQTRESQLATCHRSLGFAIGAMHALESGLELSGIATSPPPTYELTIGRARSGDAEDEALKSSSTRRRSRKEKNKGVLIDIEDTNDVLSIEDTQEATTTPPLPASQLTIPWHPHPDLLDCLASRGVDHVTPCQSDTSGPWQPLSLADSPWDLIASEDPQDAAADALDNLGETSSRTSAISDSLRRSATQERRRKAKARYLSMYSD